MSTLEVHPSGLKSEGIGDRKGHAGSRLREGQGPRVLVVEDRRKERSRTVRRRLKNPKSEERSRSAKKREGYGEKRTVTDRFKVLRMRLTRGRGWRTIRHTHSWVGNAYNY